MSGNHDQLALAREITTALRYNPSYRQFGEAMRVACPVCQEPLTSCPCHGHEPVPDATAGDISAIGGWLDRCEPGSTLEELSWAVVQRIAEGTLPVVRVGLLIALAARRVRAAA